MKGGPKAPVVAAPIDWGQYGRPGWRRVQAFASEYLKVPKGTGALGAFRLRNWQLEIVKGLYPLRGKRPRQGLLSLPRGNGKTGLASVLAAYALLADGVEGAQVLIVASDERQAGHTFRNVARMLELDKRRSALRSTRTGSCLLTMVGSCGLCLLIRGRCRAGIRR